MKAKKLLIDFLISVVIFGVNLALIWPFLLGGYTQQMGSIESVFVAEARFMSQTFPYFSWNPYWYTGFPFHIFYTPLLQSLMVLGHTLYSAFTIADWYRIFVGLFYALTPVSFYFLVSFLTKRKIVGLIAALAFSFLPSIGYFLPPGGLASFYGWPPWRALVLIFFGEGPHIVGLFFLPLALLFFLKAVRKASWKNVFLASLLIALLAMTNLIALIGFAVMSIIALMVELLGGNWLRKLARAMVVALFSLGAVAFWFNLSFLKAMFSIGNGGAGGSVFGAYLNFLPFFFLLAPAFLILSSLGKKKIFHPLLMSIGWILIFFTAAYFWLRNGVMLLPQGNRYFPEMSMGVALFVSWGGYLLIEKIFTQKMVWAKRLFYTLIIFLILCFPLNYFKRVWNLAMPHKNIKQTSEYKVAVWLEEKTDGERVYATGSTGFWLNTFTNVPQVRGGNDGLSNPWILHAVHQINTSENAPRGKEGETAVWWLRILNANHLVVNTPVSNEIFHDFINPGKFSQVDDMQELVNLNGDIIYKVPLNQPSLTQVVSKEDFTRLEVPKNAVDIEKIERYVNYIDGLKTRKAEFSWLGFGRARIKGEVEENEGIAIQVAYNPGWKALVDGKRIAVKEDVLGFIFLEPEKTGEIMIELSYHRTGDIWFGYFLTFLTIGGWLTYPKLVTIAARLFKKTGEEWKKDE